MRIDKFLKNSRLIKRRSVAKEACDAGKITINSKVAKAGSEVAIGDILELTFGEKVIKVEVTELKEHVTKDDSKEMYRQLN